MSVAAPLADQAARLSITPADRAQRSPSRFRSWARHPVLVRLGVHRPDSLVESTRWLFWVLVVVSTLAAAPGLLVVSRGWALTVVVLGVTFLLATSTQVYLRRRTRVAFDVLEAVCLGTLTLISPVPGTMFGLLFPFLWFRSLYGSLSSALVRFVVYAVAMLAAMAARPEQGGEGIVGPLTAAGNFAGMLITIGISRHLAASVTEREREVARRAVQGWLGSRLLGVTDEPTILALGWEATERVVRSSPGLHVLLVSRSDRGVEVQAHPDEPPLAVDLPPGAVLAMQDVPLEVVGSSVPQLERYVGAHCEWRTYRVPDRRSERWLLVGFEGEPSADVMEALHSLVSQVTLAIRTSDAHQKLSHQALVDGLTGLANRAAFETALQEAVTVDVGAEGHVADGAPADTGGGIAVLFIDLDDFKDVNDGLGHQAGDQVLREVGVRLRRQTRGADLVGRLGGDEFAILATIAGPGEARHLGERVVAALNVPLDLGVATAHLGASVGVAMGTPGDDAVQLVRRADVAMYAAKAAGKGTVQVYAPELDGRLPAGRAS